MTMPSVTLISHTPEADVLLVFTKSTRLTMSPGGLQRIRDMSPAQRLAELAYMANTIPSSWEFVDYVFLVERVSRAYTHQQVRTRTGSYAQQTMRVLDMGEFEYVFTDRNEADPAVMEEIGAVNERIRRGYARLRALGQPAEDARGILPTNIATNIVCKFNLRGLADLARSRTGGRTQGEYQHVINAMLDAVIAVHPWAEKFLFPADRDAFAEIEDFAKREFKDDILKRGELLKIVDFMRKRFA